MNISVIIPCYNEEKRIRRCLDYVIKYFEDLKYFVDCEYELIFVNDGSTDKTLSILYEYVDKIRIITYSENKGKGYAVREGGKNAKYEWFMFMDCDLSTKPEEIEKFIPYMNDYDILIASRSIQGSKVIGKSFTRHISGYIFNLLTKIINGLNYKDTQCGFKVFSGRSGFLFGMLETKGWAFDVELLVLAKKYKYKVKEIPVIWTDNRETKIKLLDASIGMFKELLRIRKICKKL